jgi:hypothetical protein
MSWALHTADRNRNAHTCKWINSFELCITWELYFLKTDFHALVLQHIMDLYSLNSVAWVRERTIRTERGSIVGEVNAKFEDRECHVISVMDPYGRILCFLDRSRYFFLSSSSSIVLTRLSSRPVTDTLLLKKCSDAGNRTRTSGFIARNSVY